MYTLYRVYIRLFAMLLLVGCGGAYDYPPPFPGDGRLVIVHVAEELDTMPKCGTTAGQLVRQGLRYWDTVGAQFRAPDQVDDGATDVAGELTVGVVTLTPPADPNSPELVGYFDGYNVYVNVTAIAPWDRYQECSEWFRTLAAHEIGHAMGLEHVPDLAVMFWELTPEVGATAPDIREWQHIWGNR